MKKVVRMLGLCALVALAFTACKKNDTKSVTFKASMPNVENSTRTHVNGAQGAYWLEWNDDDAIKVLNDQGDEMDFTLTTNNGQDAEFQVVGTEGCNFLANLETKDYVAFYPYASYTKGNSEVRMSIPAAQTIVGNFYFANNLYPMAATNDGINFQFDSNAGFVYFVFTASEGTPDFYITHVVLTSNTPNDLSGDMVYNLDGSFNRFEGTGNVITASWPVPKLVNQWNAADLSIILPEGALNEGFNIKIYNDNELINEYNAPSNPVVAKTYREFDQMPLR